MTVRRRHSTSRPRAVGETVLRAGGRGARLALLGALVALSAACGDPAAEAPTRGPVPIIIVDLDTLRADHLGVYGYDEPTSPHLDRFANEAARFEWAFAQGPDTPSSQASILTGLYPTTHRRIDKPDKVADEVVTLAESLQGAGFDTAAFVDGGLMARGFGLEQGFDLYDDEAGRLATIGPKARRWLEGRGAADPFLLLVHTYDIHSPYENTPEPFRSMFLGGLEMPSPEFRANVTGAVSRAFDTRHQETPEQLTEAEVAYTVALYDGGIRHVDDWFGDFVRFLEQQELYERSIIVVVSDHGEEFQEHDTLLHDRLWATVTRVPLMIRFPGGRYRGVYPEVVETIDLVPTLLDFVGVEAPRPMHGASLLPLLRGERVPRSLAFSESPYWGRRVAVADAELRLLTDRDAVAGADSDAAAGADSDEALFRYRDDPLEQTPLDSAGAPDLTAAQRELLEALAAWQRFVELDAFEGETVDDLDPETEDQLRALGYIS